MVIVDCAHYTAAGRRDGERISLERAAACAGSGDGFVWVGVHDPSLEEMAELRERFALHELAIEDAANLHQRPKLEDYDDGYFVVLRPACYHDDREVVEIGEIHLFLGHGYVISVRHGPASELSRARKRLEERVDLLQAGPASVFWAILDVVVDDYAPVVQGLDDDVEEVEETVFAGVADQTQRIYQLKRENLQLYRAVNPLLEPLAQLAEGKLLEVHPELRRFFRDVEDHTRRVNGHLLGQRELLTSILQANAAMINVRQGDIVRKVSGWAAIITVPTFIASVYGMNFDHMPELHVYYGYPLALAFMLLCAVVLYRYFKHVGWL